MPEPESTHARRVVLVVGSDPPATSTVAAALAALGVGDLDAEGDGRWASALHAELLERCGVEVDDARPAAWFETGKACANGITRARVTEWLGQRFVHAAGEKAGQPRPELVVADAGLPWLLGLWRAAALRCDATVAHVVVLTPPAAQDAGSAASWVNRMLHLERSTRDDPAREFVSYADVAADWTIPVVALGRDLGLRSVQEATANQIRRGHEVVAAGPPVAELPPAATVPPALRELAVSVWTALVDGAVPDRLDALREAYLELYTGAESMTGSSLRAAVRAAGGVRTPAAPDAATVADRARDRVRRVLRG